MRLDLHRVRIELEPERFDEPPREPLPVDLRIGGEVRVVVPDRAVRLAGELHRPGRGTRAAQAMHEVRDLLPERRGRRRLTVRAREHRIARVRMRELHELLRQGVDRREQHLVARAAHHQRVGEVVDVLGRAREVDECRGVRERRVVGDPLADPVLDRLDVVVGLALDRLHALAVGFGEPGGECAQLRCRRRRERRDFGDARLGTECDQPLDLDVDTMPDERELAEPRPQALGCAGVAPVERR